MMRDMLKQDWFGPFIVTAAAIVIVGALQPSFLSPFNIQILLLAISINALVAFSQMIIIAIGQMNLSVGAIGGLAAISFRGHDGGLGPALAASRGSSRWPSASRRAC